MIDDNDELACWWNARASLSLKTISVVAVDGSQSKCDRSGGGGGPVEQESEQLIWRVSRQSLQLILAGMPDCPRVTARDR